MHESMRKRQAFCPLSDTIIAPFRCRTLCRTIANSLRTLGFAARLIICLRLSAAISLAISLAIRSHKGSPPGRAHRADAKPYGRKNFGLPGLEDLGERTRNLMSVKFFRLRSGAI